MLTLYSKGLFQSFLFIFADIFACRIVKKAKKANVYIAPDRNKNNKTYQKINLNRKKLLKR